MAFEIIAAHMPADVAEIVYAYYTRFMRPFRPFHCVVCGVRHSDTWINLCHEHRRMCQVCLLDVIEDDHMTEVDTTPNLCGWCRDCGNDADYGFSVFERLYAKRDELDRLKFDHHLRALTLELAQLRSHRTRLHDRRYDPETFSSLAHMVDLNAAEESIKRAESHLFNKLLASMAGVPYTPVGPALNTYMPRRPQLRGLRRRGT